MVSGVGTLTSTSSEGDGETGSVILGLSEQLVVAMTPSTETKIKKEMHTSTVGKTKLNFTLIGQIWVLSKYKHNECICVQDLSLVAIGSLSYDSKSSSLSAKEYEMKINLEDLARANNGKSFF